MNGKATIGQNIREVIFGVEDGAIGNLGLVVGMAQALAPNKLILLAGIATMFAQAISMFAGKAYSKHKKPFSSSVIMALSVIVGAVIPLLAFLIWESQGGIIPAVIITLLGLFVLGAVKTRYTLRNWFRSGMEVLLVGFIAASVGYVIGNVFA